MSERTVYVIPKNKFEVGEFKQKVETVFKRLKLINGYYNKDNSWFNAGNNAYFLFEDDLRDENPPFEYLEIHDTKNNRLLPEGLQEPAECRVCHTDLHDEINELLFTITEKEHDERKETDMTNTLVYCPNCNQERKLSDLSYQEKIAITNQYLCFVDIADDLKESSLVEIEKELKTAFEIIYSGI